MNKKFFLRISVLVLISVFGISLISCKRNKEDIKKTDSDIIIENSNILEDSLEAKEVINNFFKYMNEKDEDKISSYFVPLEKNSSKRRLFNLDYINLLEINLVTDKLQYENYIISILLKQKKLNVEKLKIYEVKYDIKFINDEIEPVKNGETKKEFFVVKLRGSDEWLIEAIGTM
ncbi:hypothetical protein A500_19224 [Clostridium sartagoforme AAU1]|uniref:DUF4829 domain-containing protein n=1 Tax=Clostridium sartagoforme AAU1 TaxID=1202534 RepID=R9BTD9_9CLOT|nr:DUF4829 domain-containing protein [Clostridium sartagoforme]EOR19975.1 hypothetical protein A500_19224 [Clostridium sartagoforme AAU1]